MFICKIDCVSYFLNVTSGYIHNDLHKLEKWWIGNPPGELNANKLFHKVCQHAVDAGILRPFTTYAINKVTTQQLMQGF